MWAIMLALILRYTLYNNSTTVGHNYTIYSTHVENIEGQSHISTFLQQLYTCTWSEPFKNLPPKVYSIIHYTENVVWTHVIGVIC